MGNIHNLNQLVPSIFQEILREFRIEEPEWHKSIKKLFGETLKIKINLGIIEVSYQPSQDERETLVRNFPQILHNFIEKIKPQKKGLFIILNDINGLAKNPDFPNWYKSFVDYSSTHFEKFPILFILIGLPQKFDQCNKSNPSFGRIFDFRKIEPLPNKKVEEFFQKSFSEVDIKIEPKLLNWMAVKSGGIPYIMQEIGKGIFQCAKGNNLTLDEFIRGIMYATNNLGAKHIDRTIYGAKSSEKYQTILHKIFTQESVTPILKKQKIKELLNKDEQKVFDNLIQRLKKLGIIHPRKKEEYIFSNLLYYQYFYLREFRIRPKKEL